MIMCIIRNNRLHWINISDNTTLNKLTVSMCARKCLFSGRSTFRNTEYSVFHRIPNTAFREWRINKYSTSNRKLSQSIPSPTELSVTLHYIFSDDAIFDGLLALSIMQGDNLLILFLRMITEYLNSSFMIFSYILEISVFLSKKSNSSLSTNHAKIYIPPPQNPLVKCYKNSVISLN
jgi:hypothetical protein